MSEYEFFNRMINRIDKDYGYDIANEFQRLFIKKENESIELQQRIDKAIEYIKDTPKIVKSIHLRDKESNFIFIENKVKEELLEILKGE